MYCYLDFNRLGNLIMVNYAYAFNVCFETGDWKYWKNTLELLPPHLLLLYVAFAQLCLGPKWWICEHSDSEQPQETMTTHNST